jgi:ssDNA-binding Zn-finger/Zn-ribbon topoisomerase 1
VKLKMKIIDYTGECPECGEVLNIIKTNQFKRYAQCDNPDCNISYGLPKKGKITRSGYCCPETQFPILIIEQVGKNIGTAYFWTDKPCFTCRKFDSKSDACNETKELIEEFTENGEYGFQKAKSYG